MCGHSSHNVRRVRLMRMRQENRRLHCGPSAMRKPRVCTAGRQPTREPRVCNGRCEPRVSQARAMRLCARRGRFELIKALPRRAVRPCLGRIYAHIRTQLQLWTTDYWIAYSHLCEPEITQAVLLKAVKKCIENNWASSRNNFAIHQEPVPCSSYLRVSETLRHFLRLGTLL